MPLVRISHTIGKPDGFSQALSIGVHRAMTDTFGVPADDYFQVVTEHRPGTGMVGPEVFLGIAHTADLVMIQITCAEGRSLQQKQALYAAIAANLTAAAGIRTEDIIINLVETRRENWSFGNGIAQFAPVEASSSTQVEETPAPAAKPGLPSARMLHTMLRVRDLDLSLDFYTRILGMRLLRRQEFPQRRFTLAFVGYGAESETTVLELTHNWDQDDYVLGTAFGHIALGVVDVALAAKTAAAAGAKITRPPGPLQGDPSESIAFLEDPDGYKVELIERKAGAQPHQRLQGNPA